MFHKTGLTAALCLFLCTSAQARKGLKVFISADMEGVSMVTGSKSLTEEGREYGLNCKLMTEEVNAAVQGALDAGATEVVVRDGHYVGMNIAPDLLHPKAHLIRSDSGGPLNMMEGIDNTFDAVVYVGYHARAGSRGAVRAHTMWGEKFTNIVINQKEMPEGGINALIAGHFNVPVVLVAGDEVVCQQVRGLVGPAECAVVKKGIGKATRNLPILESRKLIRQKTKLALRKLKGSKPYRLKSPYTVELTLHYPEDAFHVSQLPDTKRISDLTVAYERKDLLEAMKFLTNSMFVLAGALE